MKYEVLYTSICHEQYCGGFGAKVTFEMKNDAQTAYEHCELSVNDEPILAVAEAPKPYDVSVIHRMRWQTMTFNPTIRVHGNYSRR